MAIISAAAGNKEVSLETTLDELGIDSITFLEMILTMEDFIGVRLRSESLNQEALATCGSLVDFVNGQARD